MSISSLVGHVCILHFVVDAHMFRAGGDGPKLIEILQMREKFALQDRIELLGPVKHGDVRKVIQLRPSTSSS